MRNEQRKRIGHLLFSKPVVYRGQFQTTGGFLKREIDPRPQRAHQTWEKLLESTESKVIDILGHKEKSTLWC